MPCETLQCPATGGRSRFPALGSVRLGSVSVLMAMGCVHGPRMLSLFFFVMFADANVACIYEMTPCFQKKKTNILNMFTENCLLYIHIIIYLFYSQCALHNQDIGFVAFCPCSHPNCCSLFVKTFTDVGL